MNLDDLVIGIMVVDISCEWSFGNKILQFPLCGSTVGPHELYYKNSFSRLVYSDICHGS